MVGKGDIRVHKAGATSREIMLYHVGAGETCILTASCVLAGVSYPASARVEKQAEAVLFPAPTFREWVAENDQIRQFVFETLAKRVATAMALIEEITFRKMDANVGSIDKVVRIVLALVFFSLFFALEGNWRFVAAIGFIPLVTAFVSWCPLYSLLGVNTCPREA
ncbi:MAG: YgaP-like transmembrane domain [bacterium]